MVMTLMLANSAKPGLIFKKDSGNDHPGTNLVISNGTIQGGNGSACPSGWCSRYRNRNTRTARQMQRSQSEQTQKSGWKRSRCRRQYRSRCFANGGNGGAGIEGEITPTIDGGTVTGGNGGKGGSSDTGAPGNGGNRWNRNQRRR